MYLRTKSPKARGTSYPISIPNGKHVHKLDIYIYIICMSLVRNSCNTFFLSLYPNSYSTCEPTKSLWHLFIRQHATRHDSEVFTNNNQGQSCVALSDPREGERNNIIKTIHGSARNMEDRYSGNSCLDMTELALPRPSLTYTGRSWTAGEGDDHDRTAVVIMVLLLKTITRRRAIASGRCRHCRAVVSNR